MFRLSDLLLCLLVFIPSVWALTKFKKQGSFSQNVIFLTLSLAIFCSKGSVPFLIYLAAFIPLLSLEVPLNPSDEPKKAPTTIQEKIIVYLSLMPLFGLLILKKDDFDKTLKNIELPISQLWVTEVAMVIMLLLTLAGSYRLRRK
ncbi:MAG: hypothetical protein NXH75_01505 [Halobacteriovoraceae bacterium]|nr:hypothetical protein [Halobacteriovoraceae bacterium]